jgi:hypothetical protein
MRLVERGIERPPALIMVCFSDDVGDVPVCEPLAGASLPQ